MDDSHGRLETDAAGQSGIVGVGPSPEYLILGGDSLIGRYLTEHLKTLGIPVISTSRRANVAHGQIVVDLDRPDEWPSIIPSIRTAYLLAGATDMAACEREPIATRRINVSRVLEFACAVLPRDAHVIMISTNLVFDGCSQRACTYDPYRPQNAYAAQKVELERALLRNFRASVLRITKIAESLESLIEMWARTLKQGLPIHPFSDLVCSPIPLLHIVNALERIGADRLFGIHQISADRDIGYDEIARDLARRLGASALLVKPTTSERAGVHLTAIPHCTTLNSSSTERALSLKTATATDTLNSVFNRILTRIET